MRARRQFRRHLFILAGRGGDCTASLPLPTVGGEVHVLIQPRNQLGPAGSGILCSGRGVFRHQSCGMVRVLTAEVALILVEARRLRCAVGSRVRGCATPRQRCRCRLLGLLRTLHCHRPGRLSGSRLRRLHRSLRSLRGLRCLRGLLLKEQRVRGIGAHLPEWLSHGRRLLWTSDRERRQWRRWRCHGGRSRGCYRGTGRCKC
mmetsp:Transcript_20993/g.44689  ORF Transcript_20993/g.44689 Transcript_20993/m.44689 type:complete len:203 (+) Transcript_20993:1204-1812(+)